MKKARRLLWRILGIDYEQAIKVHDYVFLKNDTNCSIGNRTYDNGALVFRWTDAPLVIGKFCSIANNVRFILDEGYHHLSQITSYPLINNIYKSELLINGELSKQKYLDSKDQKKGITIGNDVWIGMNVLIMPGVRIGNGVTIAANSVVTKDLPDFTVAIGAPAKIAKNKLSEEQKKMMNVIRWWDWDEKKIKKNIHDFYELSPEKFIEKHKS